MAAPLTWTRSYGWRAARHNFENISFFIYGQSVFRGGGDPISTRMMEAWRDAIEDWQYCSALRKALAAARKRGIDGKRLKESEQLIDDVLKEVLERQDNVMPYFPANTQEVADAIDQAREKLAQEIMAVRKLKR